MVRIENRPLADALLGGHGCTRMCRIHDASRQEYCPMIGLDEHVTEHESMQVDHDDRPREERE